MSTSATREAAQPADRSRALRPQEGTAHGTAAAAPDLPLVGGAAGCACGGGCPRCAPGSETEDRGSLPPSLRRGVETLSGLDLSGVRVHRGSSEPGRINALAFTRGRDIHLAAGQDALLPHEAWHAVQQVQGRVEPAATVRGAAINDQPSLEREADVMGAKASRIGGSSPSAAPRLHRPDRFPDVAAQRATHYTVRTSRRARVRPSPGAAEAAPENLVETQAAELAFERATDLELLDSSGAWIEVRGEAVAIEEGMVESVRPAGVRSGWIRTDETNLAPASDTTTENLRVAQDLDDFMDAKVLPAMLRWETGVRTQGQAYALAHERFSRTLEAASQEAKDRADFYAAVLTAVSVGSLGWIGEAAMSARSVTRILSSETVRGSIEDALQAAVGEGIDLVQGGWFTRHVNRETHPLRYLNGALRALADTKADLIEGIGNAKARISRGVDPVDRARVLVRIHRWWDGALLRHTPTISAQDEEPLAEEFERGFWAEYIKEDLTRIAPLPYYEGWTLHTYYHPESAVEGRLDDLGITSDAGIDSWDSWYNFTDTAGPRDIADHVRAIGSPWTQKLYAWAVTYEPLTFG